MGEAAPTLLDTNNVKHVLGEESSSESTPGRPAAQHSAPVSRIPRLIQSPKAQNKIPMINLQGQRSHSVTGQIAAEEKPGSSILESTMLYNRSRRPSTAPKERTEVNAVILSQESRREKEVAQNNQEGQHQLRHVLDGSSTTASLDSMAAPVKEARRALSARSSVTLNARQSEVQENLNDEPKISSIDNNEKRARSQLECSSIANLTAKEQSRSNSLRNPGAGMAASDCAEHHQSGGIPHAHHNDRYSHRSYCSRSPPGSVLLSMVHFRRNGTRATTTGTLGKSNRLPFLKGLKEAVVDSERGPPTSPINRFALGRASSVPRYPPSCFTPLGCGVEDRAFGITLAGGCGENRVLGPACVYGRTDGFVKAPPVQRNEHVRKTKVDEQKRSSSELSLADASRRRNLYECIMSEQRAILHRRNLERSSNPRLVLSDSSSKNPKLFTRFGSNFEWSRTTRLLVQAREDCHAWPSSEERFGRREWVDNDQRKRQSCYREKLGRLRYCNEDHLDWLRNLAPAEIDST